MKRIFASLLTSIALITSNVASLGCILFLSDEPDAINLFND